MLSQSTTKQQSLASAILPYYFHRDSGG